MCTKPRRELRALFTRIRIYICITDLYVEKSTLPCFNECEREGLANAKTTKNQQSTRRRNRSENYEFFQAVSHFTFESCANKQLTTASARKIYNLYVSEAAPLRVALGDEIYQDVKKVCVRIGVGCNSEDELKSQSCQLFGLSCAGAREKVLVQRRTFSQTGTSRSEHIGEV